MVRRYRPCVYRGTTQIYEVLPGIWGYPAKSHSSVPLPVRRDGNAFQRLSWHGNVVGSAPDYESDEVESLAIMVALSGGYRCSDCAKPLSESDGFICHQTVHCPVCGLPQGPSYASDLDRFDKVSSCGHLVMANFFNTYAMPCWYSALVRADELDSLKERIFLKAPASGTSERYPQWSDSQVRNAYSPEIAPLARHLFGYDLRVLDEQRFYNTLLRLCLHPAIKTVNLSQGHEYYFCYNKHTPFDRLLTWCETVADGTKRLRAMQPVRFVRDWAV